MGTYGDPKSLSIAHDPFYRECISLATNSGSDEICFGALVVKDGKIIGRGWNRLVNQKKTGALPIVMGTPITQRFLQ